MTAQITHRVGPGKGVLKTAKSTRQYSSFNLGRMEITFELNSLFFLLPRSYPSPLSLKLVGLARNLLGKLISDRQWKSCTAQQRANILHFVSAGAYCQGFSSPTKSVAVG